MLVIRTTMNIDVEYQRDVVYRPPAPDIFGSKAGRRNTKAHKPSLP